MELASCTRLDRLGIDDSVFDIDPVGKQVVVSLSMIASETV